MKKLFLSVMIILPSTLLSQTVSNLTVSAGSPSTVTFDVKWDKAAMTSPWLDSIWVFVDYNKNGKMTRMLITGGTLTEHSGTGEFIPENTMGAWVYGDARTNGSFSATVQLLTATADLYGACAYASSYPPVGQYVSATEIAFTGTPIYEIRLLHTDGNTVETVEAGSAFLLPCDYTMSSFTDATGAPGVTCLTSATYTLSASALSLCVGESALFALSGTEIGRKYQLFRNNIAVGTVLSGDGSPATFSGTFGEAGVYTAQSVADGMYCGSLMGGAPIIGTYPAISPGEITNTAANATAGVNPPSVIIASMADATGGSGNITYEWRRTGTSTATLTGSAATYAIAADASNHMTAGTYYFNRYAKDATCNTAWVAATGTYTLNLEEGPFPITLCVQCCGEPSTLTPSTPTWVDCYVTTNAYPFGSTFTNTQVTWSGNGNYYYDEARSPWNGRANTESISTYTASSAIGTCLGLGPGWYLPAYEELAHMSAGTNVDYPPLNGRSGANLLTPPNGEYWSSTETYDNGGRYSPPHQDMAVTIYYFNSRSRAPKETPEYIRCAWRP